MQNLEKMLQLSNELEEHTISVRRQIHSHPELSYQEFETSALVRRELDRIGIPYEESPCKPGVIGLIDSGKPGKTLLLRADMDALPIQEKPGFAFASTVPNVMHACGHDVHTANLLAVAEILNRMKDSWTGKVKLAFQPAEENGGGGREMIKAGLMDEVPDACFALHINPPKKGLLVVGSGYLTAYSDSYTIKVHGKAAHSSKPQEGVDAIYIASCIVQALHAMVSRNLSPMDRSTVNVGVIKGGTAPNIIPEEAEMIVMLRNLTKEARDTMLERIPKIAVGIAESMGGTCELSLREGYPAVYNDAKMTSLVEKTLREVSDDIYRDFENGKPDEYMLTGDHPLLGAEDFGFYAAKAPSCLVWVGACEDAPQHNPDFFVDEKYIKLCTRVMASVALEYLA